MIKLKNMENTPKAKGDPLIEEVNRIGKEEGLDREQRIALYYKLKTNKEKVNGKWLHIATVAGLLAIALLRNTGSEDALTEDIGQQNFQTEESSALEVPNTNIAYSKQVVEQNTEPPIPRFDESVYNALPEYGKEVYKYMAENDPTPMRGYMFLDKNNGILYAFDKNNKVQNAAVAGFGKTKGDAPNTSIEYNKGDMTTPAGVYMLSTASTQKDIEEYGKLQYLMLGFSVLGDRVHLGIHQTFSGHGELNRRTSRLSSDNPEDNRFSNGCINVDEGYFSKVLKKIFIGDNELIFVLPDEESYANFDIKILMNKIAPSLIDINKQKIEILKNKLSKAKDAGEVNRVNRQIEDAIARIEKLEEIIKKAEENSGQ